SQDSENNPDYEASEHRRAEPNSNRVARPKIIKRMILARNCASFSLFLSRQTDVLKFAPELATTCGVMSDRCPLYPRKRTLLSATHSHVRFVLLPDFCAATDRRFVQ